MDEFKPVYVKYSLKCLQVMILDMNNLEKWKSHQKIPKEKQ